VCSSDLSGLSQLNAGERPGSDSADPEPGSTASATILRGNAELFRK
jgi:hypothetical protein